MEELDRKLNTNSQISIRILEFIESKHLTTAKFERVCGLSNGYVSKIKGSISETKLNGILSKFPDFPTEYVLTGVKKHKAPESDVMVASDNIIVPPNIAEIIRENELLRQQVNGLINENEQLSNKLAIVGANENKVKKALRALVDGICGDNPSLKVLNEE